MTIDIEKSVFFSAEDICTRLSVSRSTFDRWRRPGAGRQSPFGPSGGFQQTVNTTMRTLEDIENEQDDALLSKFPEPTLNVGGQPRWSAEAVNGWLIDNKDKQNKRGRVLRG
jgi:hypothetical protein